MSPQAIHLQQGTAASPHSAGRCLQRCRRLKALRALCQHQRRCHSQPPLGPRGGCQPRTHCPAGNAVLVRATINSADLTLRGLKPPDSTRHPQGRRAHARQAQFRHAGKSFHAMEICRAPLSHATSSWWAPAHDACLPPLYCLQQPRLAERTPFSSASVKNRCHKYIKCAKLDARHYQVWDLLSLVL